MPARGDRAAGVAGETARAYCARFPGVSSRGLARMLVEEEPDLFATLETARMAVRRYRGEMGEAMRAAVPAARQVPTCKPGGFQVPESHAAPILPYHLAVRGAGGVVADLHIPFHDRAAVELAMESLIRRHQTDFLVVLGDLMDCHEISDWERDPRTRRLVGEREDAVAFLAEAKRHFRSVVYKGGNHERRYWRYIRGKAPALCGHPAFEFREFMDLPALGVEFVEPQRMMVAGKLRLLHGHEWGGQSSAYPARTAFQRLLKSTLVGHFHRTTVYTETDADRHLVRCWSIGTLQEPHVEYAPVNKWDAGFAELDLADDSFEVRTHSILEGRVI